MKKTSMFIVMLILITTPYTRPNALLGNDETIVAALDTEYQAAVKNNDVATMDRILADDFVLVTGKGTTYTKADLLKSAREKLLMKNKKFHSSICLIQDEIMLKGDLNEILVNLMSATNSNNERVPQLVM